MAEPPALEVSPPGQVLPDAASSGPEKLMPPGCAGFPAEPPLGASYDSGLDVPDGAGISFIPPDVAGSVGPDHLMAMLNNKTLIQDRQGGVVASVDTSVFWSPLGATPLSPTNGFHRLSYDSIHGRWIASAKNGTPSTSRIFLAISATNDPTGAWDYYSFLADPAATQQADWVVHGYNQTWISITADMFNLAGSTLIGPKMWAIDKSTALAGGPLTVTVFATGYVAAATGVAGSSRLFPSRAFDSSDTDMYILGGSSFTSSGEFIHQWVRLSGTAAAPTVAPVGPTLFSPATASLYPIAPGVSFSSTQRVMSQLGDARSMNPFSVRIAGVVVRNGRVWAVQSGGLPGPAGNAAPASTGVLWYELDPTAMPSPVVQSGTIDAGASTASITPSIAVNCGNDVLVGFSNGDSTRFARACYAIRLGTDPLDTMGPIRELQAGESSYWKNFGIGSPTTCLWGRWSASTVDPLDDKTLWTVQQFAGERVGAGDNDSRWSTRWGRFGSCGAPTILDDPDAVTVCLGDPASFSVSATPFVAPLAYQWRKNGVDIPGATSSTYSIASTVAGDGANYDVIVEDGCGTITSDSALLAFAGPAISAQPVTIRVRPGDPASFSVGASGAGTLTYQWLFNGNPIPLASGSSFSIPAIARTDWGAYSCVVTDDCGPATSDTAFLLPRIGTGRDVSDTRLGPRLRILADPSSQEARLGGTAMLAVVANLDGVSYLWRKNGSVILPIETSRTLVLSPVGWADAGAYDVLVSLGNWTRISAQAFISVTDPSDDLTQLSLPSDAGSACASSLTTAEVNAWFETGVASLDGAVKAADSVTFPDIPNCSFYEWSEQMFLWLTSPAPARYGGGGLVMNTPAFYDVSAPDASGQRHFVPHTSGIRTFNVRVPQNGPLGLPVAFEKGTLRMLQVLPHVLSPSGRDLVLDMAGNEVEVHDIRFKEGVNPVLIDRRGNEILSPRAMLRSRSDSKVRDFEHKLERLEREGGFDRSGLVQPLVVGTGVLLGPFGQFTEVEQGQADGGVLMDQNGSLVYYAITVNNVFVLYRTMFGATVPPGTKFPVTQTDLDAITAFAAQNGHAPVIDSEALAIEIKTSWVEASGLSNPEKFIKLTGIVPTYDKTNPNDWVPTGTKTTTLAMVGMHVVGSTKGHPEMLWGTFEHESNAPSAEYTYLKTNSTSAVVPQNTVGSWVFCASGSNGPFNQKRMSMGGLSGDHILPNPTFSISASDILRTMPWGLPGTAANKNAEVISINNTVRSVLDPDDVRINYIQHGTTWTIGGASPNAVNQVGTNKLANTTIESFVQGSTNCFSCHTTNTTSVSFMFNETAPLF